MHHWVQKDNSDKKEHSDDEVVQGQLQDPPFAIRMKDYEIEIIVPNILVTPLHRLPISIFTEKVVVANRDLSIGITKTKSLYQSVLHEMYF